MLVPPGDSHLTKFFDFKNQGFWICRDSGFLITSRLIGLSKNKDYFESTLKNRFWCLEWLFTKLNSSHDVLSMIFGFLRKFWVGIYIFRKKNQDKNIFWKFDRNIFLGRKFFGRNFLIRFSKNFRKKSDFFFDIFFDFENIFIFWKKYIPTQNFVRNPKIILRKSCDHAKDTKNTDSNIFDLIPHRFRTLI